MNNCILRKNKGVVDDDSLEIYGAAQINNFGTEKVARSMTEFSGNNLKIKRTLGKMYNSSGVEQTEIIGDICKFYFENDDTTNVGSVILYGKNKIESIKNVYNFPGDVLSSLLNLTTFDGTLASGSTDSKEFFKKTNYVSLSINGKEGFKNYQSTDMAPLRNSTTLETFISACSSGEGFYFDDLGRYLPDCVTTIQDHQKGIRGHIENFVANARINRATGSVAIKVTGSQGKIVILFNNSNITVGSHTLSWTATTITFDGTTIENSDVAN